MVSHEDDAGLLGRAKDGDRDAFGALVGREDAPLRAFIETRLGRGVRQSVETDDIVQETHLRALRSLERFEWRNENSLFSWLAAIAEFVIRDHARAQRRRERVALLDQQQVPASVLSPSRVLRREERFERLRSALETLADDHRQVVWLARIERLPLNQVAERMHRSRGAVKQLLLRALQKLRESFGDTESLGLPQRKLREEGDGHGA